MIEVRSSDLEVERGFQWAVAMAKSYAFASAVVGPCYEAALPGRQAFCIRDTAHQSTGAQILGLGSFTKNMMFRFAENIASSRNWCTYWEITQDNLPAAEDYEDDAHFWYNLPANFDLMDCCYRQYLWTGDQDYVANPLLTHFYAKTLNDYVQVWDRDHDGVLEHYPQDGHRGIATYNEQCQDPLIGGDMLAAQYAGFVAGANLSFTINPAKARRFRSTAEELRQRYNRTWWDHASGQFYGMRDQHGDWLSQYAAEGHFLPLYFGIVDPGVKTNASVQSVIQHGASNIEGLTYLIDIFYQYGRKEEAYRLWTSLPHLPRCEYPEVAFSMVGAVVAGMAGVYPEAPTRTLVTRPRLTSKTDWLELTGIPVFDGTVDVTHIGNAETHLTNNTSRPVVWRADFQGSADHLWVGGVEKSAQIGRERRSYLPSTRVDVQVKARGSAMVELR